MGDDGVRLRPFREDDLALLTRFATDPSFSEPFEWGGFRSPEGLRRRWEEDGFLDQDPHYLVVAGADDAALGWVMYEQGYRGFGGTGVWAIGILLAPDHRGRGVGTEAQRLLVDHLFATTRAHRLVAITESDNIAEQRALEKCAFQREGLLRQGGFRGGAWRDVVVYGQAARRRVAFASMAEEVSLSDGFPSVAQSTLVNGQVHRATGPWTPAVQALLRYLEDVGFDGAPRVVGFDADGREVLTWIDGEAPQVPWPPWMQTDDALGALASLLRRYHDAVEGFTPPPDATWRRWLGAPGGPIIRHGDLWPSNVVFRDGLPVALIDWEFAQPATRLDDIASAVKHWVPLISDGRAGGDGWHLPIDRVHRLRLFAEAYGLDAGAKRAVIPTLVRNIEFGYRSHKTWAKQGVPGFKDMWEQGSGAVMLADREWLESARAELEAFATPT